jgi:PII-like signaling protein
LPLSEKVRIEIYVPDRAEANYQNLLDAFADEFTEAFGGATVLRGFEGRYSSDSGKEEIEKMNLVYADLPLSLAEHKNEITYYLEEIKTAAHEVLNEESILITARTIFHVDN